MSYAYSPFERAAILAETAQIALEHAQHDRACIQALAAVRAIPAGQALPLSVIRLIRRVLAQTRPCLTETTGSDNGGHVAWHPNGQLLAIGNDQNWLRVWDVVHDRIVYTINMRRPFTLSDDLPLDSPMGILATSQLMALRWSSDGATLLSFHVRQAFDHAESEDDDRSATNILSRSLVALWDAASGSLRQTLVGPHDPNRICIGDWIAWSSDGTRLLISHGAYTQLWDVHAGSILHERTDVYDDSYTLLPSPDTRMVAAQCETTISVWDARTDVLLWEGLCPDQAIHTFRWSSDSTRLLTATGEWGRESHIPVEHQYVRLWDATTGAHIQAFPGAAGWLSPSGALILTVANQRFVRIWDCTTGEIRQTILLEHERAAQEIIWSPDERTLLVNTYTALELWDVASGRLITALPCSTGYSVQWSPDSRMLAAINIPYSRFLVWTVAARQPSRTLPSSQQSIEALLWGTDGIQSIVRQSGMEVHRYGPDFQSIRAKLPTGLHPQHAMWFPDQRRILMSAYVHQSYDAKEQAQPIWRWFAWDTTTNTMHELSLGHGLPTRLDWHVTTQIRFSPDGQVYACVASGAVRVFDSADHTVLQNIPVIAQIHTSIQIAWSQESTHLLIVGQSPASEARQIQIRVQMWDRAQDRLVQDTTVSRKQHVRILGLGWSPIGPQMLISVAHTGSHLQTCELWDLTHGQVHTTLDIPVPQLRHASWSPEGQQIVVFSERAAWIFNSTRGELTAVVESTAPLGAPFAWSPDGLQLLISGAWRGAVPLACHVIDPALLIAELTRRVGEFSRSTSRSYHPEYQPHEEELRSNIPDWQGERSEVAIAGNLLTQYDRMVAQLPVA